jgi:secretion/DNA translocation related TadE-like protein
MTSPHVGPDGEHGAASVLALSVVAVVLVLTMGGLVVGSVVVASHRARVAADLGSLAGASAIQDGATPVQACAVAQRVVHANGAATQWCSSRGADVELRVVVRARLWPEPATARSRAGPER